MKYEAAMITGRRSPAEWDLITREAAALGDIGSKISFLSARFIGTAYGESTLTGDAGTPEIFVINLREVDCFTFLDYIEAMRRSSSFPDFRVNLLRVRYRSGIVSYETRNHFFTDWRENNPDCIDDVTELIGGYSVKKIEKVLNKKTAGAYFLAGIPPLRRVISFIPSSSVDARITGKLRTGDYAGVYSEKEGLDVSHVGIIIKEGGRVLLRHASSEATKRMVVDDDLQEYLRDKPGLIVLRPK